MLLPTHYCLADFFSRLCKKKWRRREHLLFCFGAIAPDLPVILVGICELIKYISRHPRTLQPYWIAKSILELLYCNERPDIVNYLYATVGYHHLAILARSYLHSVLFWFVSLALVWTLKPTRKYFLPIFCGAIFFHILMDLPTHTLAAYNYFWPLTLYPVRGFISHDNPWLLRFEIAIWLIWLASALYRLSTKTWQQYRRDVGNHKI